jgi:hypothetical protein
VPSLVTVYSLLWAIVLVVAPIVCAYGLIKTSTPIRRRRGFGIAILGLLLSCLLIFSLATTVLIPLAALALPAPLVFSYAIFKPSVFSQKGIRAYLVLCMTVSDLLSIWMYWSTVVRVR